MLMRSLFVRTSFWASSHRITSCLSEGSALLLAKKENSSATFFQFQRFLSDLRYSEKHEWIRLGGSDKTLGTVGITSYAQEALGDVVYCQVPDVGSEVNQDDEIGAVESVKAANEVYTPVSGKIVEVNKALEDKPGLINSSCYDEGWIFKIQIKNQSEVDKLMDEQAYEEFLKAAH